MSSTTSQQGRRWLSRQSTQNESTSSSEAQQSPSQASTASSDTQPRSLNESQTRNPFITSPAAAHGSIITSSQQSSSPTEVRRCWICQQDDTEDTPENNIWRTPCPCSLTAHDSCLLEWIANEEAPKPGQLGHSQKIVCPQCQAEIKLERPRDLLVTAVDTMHSVARSMVFPVVVGSTLGSAYTGLLVYGMNSIALVFGSDKASGILLAGVSPSTSSWTSRYKSVLRTLTLVTDPFIPSGENLDLKLFFTLPLIAPALILMRTSYSEYLPILVPFYFAANPSHRRVTWPPSPGLAIATLPYIQRLYRKIYTHTFSSLEKQWELAVQRKPREGETAEQIAAAARAEAQQEERGHVALEIEWGEVDGEDGELDIPPAADIRAEIEAELGGTLLEDIHIVPENPALPLDGAANAGLAPPNAPQNQPGNRRNAHRAQQEIDLPQLASTVIGALFFPAISSLMGNLLKLVLPTSMTSPTTTTKGFFFTSTEVSRGLLKEKWGRSIVGGCLFVVLKDAVVLYCKWKKARDFGKRRVLDFMGERGRVSAR